MDNSPNSSMHEIIKILGRPISLVTYKIAEGAKYLECDIDALEYILHDSSIASKSISIISIIGPVRQGKSFLLNFFLKYIFSKYRNNWLSNSEQSLEGFSWNCGLKTNTRGIFLWSEPFIVNIDNEEKVILLLDCEGAYDKFSSLNDSIKLAAFDLLLSSHLLINIPHCIDDEILDFSESLMNYASLITGSWCTTKPYQHVMFVIRDWYYKSDYPYGLQGGENYFKNITKFTKILNSSKTAINDDLCFKHYCKTMFNNFQCFLLPHPGFKAATNSNFEGKLRDINASFLEHVKLLVTHIISPENLQLKKINNHHLTCKEFVQYFKCLVHIINTEHYPTIQNILTENGDINQVEFLEHLKSIYITSMDKFISNNIGFIKNERLDEEHNKLFYFIQMKINNVKQFNKSQTLEDTNNKVQILLNGIIQKYKFDNTNKNLQMSIFTPFSFVVPLPIMYFIFYFSNLFYIDIISYVLNLLFRFMLGINLLWISCCFWEIEFIYAMLDIVTDIIINYVYKPAISVFKTKPAKVLNPFYTELAKDTGQFVEQ